MVQLVRVLASAIAESGRLSRVVSATAAAARAAVLSVVGAHRLERGPRRARPDESSSVLGAWTAARLTETLRVHLHGQRVIVVANREAVIHEWSGDQGSKCTTV